MILRNGINSTLRAKGRTVLFTLLILTLTVTMTLGVGMWAYCVQILPRLDESFTSVALVEYMGKNYPNPLAADEQARQALQQLDTTAFSTIDGVEVWETNDRSLALVDGYHRSYGNIPYPDHAVLECTSFVPIYAKGITGLVEYAFDELKEENLIVCRGENEWTAKIQYNHLKTDWIPFYELTDEGYIQDSQDGVVIIPDEELPEEYIVLVPGDPYGLFYYMKEGVHEWMLKDCEDTVYYYFPATDVYYGNGDKIVEYSALCSQLLYAYDKSESIGIHLNASELDFTPEPDEHYILHGTFVKGGKNNAFVVTDFYEGCPTPPWQQTDDTDASPMFAQYAEHYRNTNDSLNVEASKNIAALEIFHQNTLTLMQGRFPESGESGVCIVTEDVAQNMELSLGDTVSMTPIQSQEDGWYNLSSKLDTRPLTVIGITGTSEEYYGSIWVTDADGNFGNPLFGYELGRAVLNNSTAHAAANAMQAACPANVRVTLYDQGYASAVKALQTMETTAMSVTFASGCGVMAVLVLFAFLFIGRQRETVHVLVSLGTEARQIRLWLLSGATLICGAATLGGAIIGGNTLDITIRLAFYAMNKLYAANQRYSESAISYVQDQALRMSAPAWPAIVAGISIFMIALLLCSLFLAQARRRNTPKRGKQSVRVPRSGTSTAYRGALRFAMLSARRGGWRSTVVPAAALLLSLLLGVLASIAQGWNAQLDAVYQETTITGQAVSNNGRQTNNLVVTTQDARTLWESGYLDTLHVSIGWNYWLPQEMPEFSNTSYGYERRLTWIRSQPELIALNGLSAVGEFSVENAPEITWLDGWDESFLTSTQYPSFITAEYFPTGRFGLKPELDPVTYPCLVSDNFLRSHNMALGDKVYISMVYEFDNDDIETYISIMPVGTYTQQSTEANIYLPLSFWCSPELLTGPDYPYDDGLRPDVAFTNYEERDRYFYTLTTFDMCTFILDKTENLESLRDYLENAKISQVRKPAKIRMTVILRDRSFTDKIEGLGRYISFSKVLFPVLFAVVALLGFLISWLMVNGRRMEFAILRGMGASERRVFMSIFLEQMLLCLFGCLLGSIGLSLLIGFSFAQCLAMLLFLLCYLVGCALAVRSVSRTNLMLLLSERE